MVGNRVGGGIYWHMTEPPGAVSFPAAHILKVLKQLVLC